MDSSAMTRKEFFVLTFTLAGTGVVVAACGSSSDNGGTGGASGGACADPLPETQEADATQHIHTVTISAATLNATTDQTFTTSPPTPSSDGHMHMITLAVAQLVTLKGGSTVTGVMSTSAGTTPHAHKFDVSCH